MKDNMSFNYNMSRYMVPLLSGMSCNEFTVSDSFSFVNEISQIPSKNLIMASFDVKSLFTNVPVAETCNIILSNLFPQSKSTFEGFNKALFTKMLNNCIENVFIFNGKVYKQVDGFPMGNCISPTMANVDSNGFHGGIHCYTSASSFFK